MLCATENRTQSADSLFNNKKFLIIDDSPNFISLMQSILNEIGISKSKVTTTTSSTKALQLLASYKFDAVICDYDLDHHIDGGMIFDEIKHQGLLPDNAVFILITGDGNPKIFAHILEMEPDDYLIKPFSQKDFDQRLSRVMKRKVSLTSLLRLVSTKKYQDAINECHWSIKTYPEYRAYIKRLEGDCLLRLNKLHSAKALYEEEIKMTSHVWPKVGLANSLFELGEIKASDEIFESILKKHPHNVEARTALGRSMLVQDSVPDALKHFKALHKINSSNPVRELIIANLSTSIGDQTASANSYFRFCDKVVGTSRYDFHIEAFSCLTFMLSAFNESKTEDEVESILAEALSLIATLKSKVEMGENKSIDSLNSLTALFGIYSASTFLFEESIRLEQKIQKEQINNFYSAMMIACLSAICGNTKNLQNSTLRAKQLCNDGDDDILNLSMLKLINSFQKRVNNVIEQSQESLEEAEALKATARPKEAFDKAIKAYKFIKYDPNLCVLLLDLISLEAPNGHSKGHLKELVDSCQFVCSFNKEKLNMTANEIQRLTELAKTKLELD
ncbi:response regulator [Shewanella sp. 202IG2-18]|uniref:response regulator n=1 Tax=Parashewanella hymeniacidonis TaxID=2807618 RepID=UPI0019619FEB|nr:response regulator [Parashewanella hymeniacidonis]MBM7070838.1 response regulator [Parashewanella hymeniacidonis]